MKMKERRKTFAVAGALVLVVITILGFKWRASHRASESPEGFAHVEHGDIQVRFHESGEILPKRAVDIVSKASGRILEMWVEEGQRVKRGQKLCLIQPGKTEVEKYLPTKIFSPIDGVVMPPPKKDRFGEARGLARPGDYVTGLFDSSDPPVLMTIADTSRLAVGLKISEMDILKLKEKMPVTVTVDALPGAPFTGRISLISPRAQQDEKGLKMFRVEATLDKADPRLRLGMSASVSALLEERKDSPQQKGLPGYTFQKAAGQLWRSRYDKDQNVVVINNGHRDFVYASRSKALKLRYICRLFSKELVFHNFPGYSPEQLLERMIELSLYTEENLR